MDIYSAEAHVKKLLAYVQSLADTKPRMYGKSKERLKEVAMICKQIIFVISEIVQEEVLCDDISEFGESNSEVNAVLDEMQEQLAKLREFTSYDDKQDSSTTTSKLKPVERKRIIKAYRLALKKVAEADSGFECADECAKMLYDWFEVRFIKTSSSGFRYNIRRIPGWIRDFVMLYGYAVHDGSRSEFKSRFYSWLDDIRNSESQSRYAVPYDVYQFNRSPDADKVSLEAAVIWDIMLDNGLSDICSNDPDSLMLEDDAVYTLCCELDLNKMDNYSNYREDPKVLKFVQLGS